MLFDLPDVQNIYNDFLKCLTSNILYVITVDVL